MLEKELTPPPDGRISSSSGSPDSLFKSSTDSSRTLSFSPDCTQTSTTYKSQLSLNNIPKLKLPLDDSDYEWEQSAASPHMKRPPSVRKIHKARSRLLERDLASLDYSLNINNNSQKLIAPDTPVPTRLRQCRFSTSGKEFKLSF